MFFTWSVQPKFQFEVVAGCVILRADQFWRSKFEIPAWECASQFFHVRGGLRHRADSSSDSLWDCGSLRRIGCGPLLLGILANLASLGFRRAMSSNPAWRL